MHPHLTRAWVDVDLGALLRNAATMAARGAPLLPMIKGNAYGLGLVPVARALERADPWGFGVATVAEGRTLRDAGVARPIIVFTPAWGGDLAAAREARLTPTFGRAEEIREWHSHGGGAWHLEIDTGMARSGVRWTDVRALADALRACPPDGAFTQFLAAERADGSLEEQEKRFRDGLAALPARPRFVHAENSAALARRETSAWDLARPGIFLYGAGSGAAARVAPEPVASVRARIVAIRMVPAGETVSYDGEFRASRDSRIATAAIGYADGYRRAFSHKGVALVRGARVPVVGIVTMDMTMLDVTGVPCEVGDVATFVGRDGTASITADAAAAAVSMSPYELLTGFGLRLEHSYREGA